MSRMKDTGKKFYYCNMELLVQVGVCIQSFFLFLFNHSWKRPAVSSREQSIGGAEFFSAEMFWLLWYRISVEVTINLCVASTQVCRLFVSSTNTECKNVGKKLALALVLDLDEVKPGGQRTEDRAAGLFGFMRFRGWGSVSDSEPSFGSRAEVGSRSAFIWAGRSFVGFIPLLLRSDWTAGWKLTVTRAAFVPKPNIFQPSAARKKKAKQPALSAK